jgi:hypothetical protein
VAAAAQFAVSGGDGPFEPFVLGLEIYGFVFVALLLCSQLFTSCGDDAGRRADAVTVLDMGGRRVAVRRGNRLTFSRFANE